MSGNLKETKSLNLLQKLAKIRQIVDVVVKNKKGFNYTYADIAQILAKVKAGMQKYEVSLIPLIVPGTAKVSQVVSVNTKVDKAGVPYEQTTTEMLYQADMVFKWIDDMSGEMIEVPWSVTGAQADPSQSFGSAMSYCTRYFLTNYFQIPQVGVNDVDDYRSKQKAAEESEERALADALIAEFDTLVREFLADNQDKKEEVQAFVSKFVKNGKYKEIHNSKLAGKLLNDFKEKYIKSPANAKKK